MQQHFYRRDTSAWIFQVWSAFVISVVLCVYGIGNILGDNMSRGFLALGFFFCLSACFGLSKMIRDNQIRQVDSPAWRLQVWFGFVVAAALTGWGLYNMQLPDWGRAYMVASWLFMVSSTFTLAKTLRDAHEATLAAVAGEDVGVKDSLAADFNKP